MSMLFVAALMMAHAPAAQAAPAQDAPQAAPAQKEKKICKVDENESSSRLRKRVCLTQTEWDQKEAGKSDNDLKGMGAR